MSHCEILVQNQLLETKSSLNILRLEQDVTCCFLKDMHIVLTLQCVYVCSQKKGLYYGCFTMEN